ncbi:TonB-dependent receptor [Sphingomonas solaris]|nr:TonB-dependent receptor [Sphingomonas solaris]
MAKAGLRYFAAGTALAAFTPSIAPAQAVAEEQSISDIVVTARREAESLQDVPVTVQVVTGNTLAKLAITRVEEISKLAPGLNLVNAAGSNTSVTLRGVTWRPGSGTPATPIYFNEAPFDPAQVIQSLFDVGQIEVLRGPQGTTRGAPSISGAVTITTRKPDLDDYGGYVQGLVGEGRHRDLQGAINVPIIKDLLAIRLATNIEESRGSQVYSVNSDVLPRFRERSYRATILFRPTDTISLQAMYQRRNTNTRTYVQVAGTGSPGLAAQGIPANFNGPALTVGDRRSVQDLPLSGRGTVDLLTINASWEVFGQQLSYNFGRQFNRNQYVTFSANDVLNIIPGFESAPTFGNVGLPKFATHEIRYSSLTDPDRPFDFDIGWFSKHSGGKGINYFTPAYLPGAFGSPLTARPGQVTTPNERYVLNSLTNIRLGQKFDSFYGNIRAHIDDRTELSGGLAIIRDRVPVNLNVQTFAAFSAFTSPLLPSRAACPFASPGAIASPVYTGGVVCETPLPNGFRNSQQQNNDKYSEALYNFSLSHNFMDDLLVYATTGTSFRTGLPAINNPGLPADLVTPDPEKATSYEVGFKASIGRRLRVNASAFQIDYKNQLNTFQGTQYFNTVSAARAQTSVAFYSNIDSRVRGVELQIDARPVQNLSLGLNLSYSKIKSQGGIVPANPGDCAGTAPVTAANPINFCPSAKGQTLNTQAPFQASINGGYELPITSAIGAYVRFNANYQGRNPNFGNFRTASGFRGTPSYTVVDLFAGLTGDESIWDLGIYAKNAFDKQAELSRVATINSVFPSFAALGGYDVVTTSRPREIGVQLRYAFGSR